MKNKEKTHGFFCRETFMEQIQLLQEARQCVELFAAAFAYTKGEKYDIKDAFVKMAFSSWRTVFDYDKKEADLFHKKKSDAGKIGQEIMRENMKRKREAEQQLQPELFKEEAASEDDVPLVEAEEVEPYPFEFFWREYISHKDEKNTRNIWKHLSNDLRKKAINGARIYTQYVLTRKSKDPKFDAVLKPSTFLKDAHWNDEYKEEELTPQNYGNNRSYQSDYERRKQQQNAVLTDFMAEAVARVQAIEDAKNRVENI